MSRWTWWTRSYMVTVIHTCWTLTVCAMYGSFWLMSVWWPEIQYCNDQIRAYSAVHTAPQNIWILARLVAPPVAPFSFQHLGIVLTLCCFMVITRLLEDNMHTISTFQRRQFPVLQKGVAIVGYADYLHLNCRGMTCYLHRVWPSLSPPPQPQSLPTSCCTLGGNVYFLPLCASTS